MTAQHYESRLRDIRLQSMIWTDGFLPTSEASLDSAKKIIHHLMLSDDEFEMPYIYASPDGGLELEWDLKAIDISLYIDKFSNKFQWMAFDKISSDADFLDLTAFDINFIEQCIHFLKTSKINNNTRLQYGKNIST